MRNTPKRDVPVPEEPPADARRGRETTTEECAVCGAQFERHPNDPPCCGQSCWTTLRSREE